MTARWLRSRLVAALVMACNEGPKKPVAPAPTDASVVASANASAGAKPGAQPGAGTETDASAAHAVWRGVRWDMPHVEVVRALEREAFKAEYRPLGASLGELTAKGADAAVEISFVQDRPVRIVVTREGLSKDAAAAVLAKLTERAGPPRRMSGFVEKSFSRQDSSVVIFKVNDENFINEDWVRTDANGSVGFAGLTWRMSPAAAKQALTTAGFDAHIDKPPTVSFAKGERSGEVTFGEAMLSVAMWGPSTDGGAARAKELEKQLGAPTQHKASTSTRFNDDVAVIELVVTEDVLAKRLQTLESYRPKP